MSIRIIPRIDIKGYNAVKGIHLEGLRVVGDPHVLGMKYYRMGADEIIFMDIVASLYQRKMKLDVLTNAINNIFVPIIIGGGIRSVDDAALLFRMGADKIAVNTAAITNPLLLEKIANAFGSQSLVLSVEAKKNGDNWEAYVNNGRDRTGVDVLEWLKHAQALGIGEVLLTSIDKEGTQSGFDIELYNAMAPHINVPLIMCGGLGSTEHINQLLQRDLLVDGLAISNVLHYDRMSIKQIKQEVDIPLRCEYA